jgi:hypothetical protein
MSSEYWLFQLLDHVRLSRLVAITSALLAVTLFTYGIIAPDSFRAGAEWAILFAAIAVSVWKLGDWWKLHQALRKAQEGMPRDSRRRGFEVVTRDQSGGDRK